jgi:hypothetical protein
MNLVIAKMMFVQFECMYGCMNVCIYIYGIEGDAHRIDVLTCGRLISTSNVSLQVSC